MADPRKSPVGVDAYGQTVTEHALRDTRSDGLGRLALIAALSDAFDRIPLTPEANAKGNRFLAQVNPREFVGSRHHTVPRFLLSRWATKNHAAVYHRVEAAFRIENVSNLAIKDFYTFIDKSGSLNSSFESLLGAIEAPAADIVKHLLSPFWRVPNLSTDQMSDLALFMSFLPVRTARRRREMELQGEWYAKTMAEGRLSDAELRQITVIPPQNSLLSPAFAAARKLIPFFANRPVALVWLQGARLLLGDEPLIVNAPVDETHHRDCFVTEDEWRRREAKEQRKKKKRRHPVNRVIHFQSTVPRGLGVADELVLPISPHAALCWGPLGQGVFTGPVETETLPESDSHRFADLANAATARQALDWLIGTVDDSDFRSMVMPPLEPLLRVCDRETAAAHAINKVPERFRPFRLDRRAGR